VCFDKLVETVEIVRLDPLVLFELREELNEGLEILEKVVEPLVGVMCIDIVELVEEKVPELEIVDTVVGLVWGVLWVLMVKLVVETMTELPDEA